MSNDPLHVPAERLGDVKVIIVEIDDDQFRAGAYMPDNMGYVGDLTDAAHGEGTGRTIAEAIRSAIEDFNSED